LAGKPNQALPQTAGHDGFPRLNGSPASPMLSFIVSQE
jgi:hypothetical protein